MRNTENMFNALREYAEENSWGELVLHWPYVLVGLLLVWKLKRNPEVANE